MTSAHRGGPPGRNVVTRLVCRGTHTGPYGGGAADGETGDAGEGEFLASAECACVLRERLRFGQLGVRGGDRA
jgi:hypothetical protein